MRKEEPANRQAMCQLRPSVRRGGEFEQFKKDNVTRFVIQKVWQKRPELKRMVDEISKEFSDEIGEMLG